MGQAIRLRRRSNFTTIPNGLIRDAGLSAEARLMMIYIMSCNDNWVFYRDQSMKVLGCGRDKYQRIIRELKEAGYLVVSPNRRDDGTIHGQIWDIIDEPEAQDAAPSTPSATQDVAHPANDREPENPAHGEKVNTGSLKNRDPVEPPGGFSGPIRKNNKQERLKESCADDPRTQDFDFDQFFESFAKAYPRMGDREATEDALRTAIENGADPSAILKGAKAYAVEQQGNRAMYIAYSQNWVSENRWREHVTADAPASTADAEKVLAYWAETIKAVAGGGQAFMRGRVPPSMAADCFAAQMVTREECQAAGVAL